MSTTMVDNYLTREYGQPVPHRKPLPQGAASHVARASNTLPFPSLSPVDPHHQSHSRSRTSSSSVFPSLNPGTTTTITSTYSMTTGNHTRRTLSNATTSTTTSSTSSQHHHHHHHPNLILGRTPSGRSTSQSASPGPPPTSYVALLRKQKATVWCERAQHEDPRLLAAQRAARKRAQLEFAGGLHGHGRTNTSSSNNSGNGGNSTSVRSKIRHHGVPKATPYNGGNMAGSGVPLRLSATEIEDEVVSDEEWVGAHGASSHQNHRRTGSGRSSLGSMSGPRVSYSGLAGQQGQQYHSQHRVGSGSISGGSAASTPHNRSGEGSPTQLDSASVSEEHLEEATPVPGKRTHGKDYFATTSVAEVEKKRSDELRRRGSVDDRTMTMSGNVRLFVANPDLD